MLTKMRAKNFKAWKDTGDIRLAPITGFFGTNSSGKTSLLQMLLLLKQTAESRDSKMVVFFGDDHSLVNLGGFRDVVFEHEVSRTLEIELNFAEDRIFRDDDVKFHGEIESSGTFLYAKLTKYNLDNNWISLSSQDSQSPVKLETSLQNDVKPFSLPERNSIRKFYALNLGSLLDNSKSNPSFWSSIQRLQADFRLEVQLNQVHYLGPLRDYPKRSYIWSGGIPDNVGSRGEYTVAALLAASQVEQGDLDNLLWVNKLIVENVASCLQDMGLIYSFEIRPIAPGRRDYEIVVKQTPNSTEVLITDVGFGITQVLPVLTLCWYVEEGSTIIFEQPEIHLHPSAQAVLADLFIEVAKKRNLQIIIESHSEYLLHRLQRRIAEEQIKADDVALYFCSMGDEAAQIETLKLDEYGNISNWPKNFFGDSTGDLIAMTEAEMKRKLAADA